MEKQIGRRGRMLLGERTLSRRQVLRGSAALSGGALAAALVGSGGRGPQAAWAQESGFSREASITSWGFGVEETNPLAFARVNAFKEAFPTIELEIVPEFDDQKLLTAAASGQVPDLLWLDRFAIASWAARGVLQPLTEFIERDTYDTSRFYEAALDEATYDGRVYGIPGGMDVKVLYVNLDALNEVGISDIGAVDTGNWEQLTDLGSQLVKRNGDQVDRWGFDTKTQAGGIYLWGGANGGHFLGEDGEATFNHPKVVEALDWAVKTYDAQGGFKSYEAVATTWQGDEQFARGQVAMSIYENWMLGIIARVAPDLNFAVLPVKPRGGEGLTSFTGGRAWTIPAGAKDPEAAWEFIKFMHTDETWLIGANAVKAAREEAGQPYLPSLTGSKTADQAQIDQVYEPIDPKFDNAVKLFPQVLAASPTREIASSPVGKQLDDIMQQNGVLPALRGEKPPAESLETADQNAQDAINAFLPA